MFTRVNIKNIVLHIEDGVKEEKDLKVKYNIETILHLNKFVPRSYQLPLVDAIENKGYKRVLAIMPRRCLAGDTHITMADGSFKFLKDIIPGDAILSWNGHAFVSDKVKHVWKTDSKPTYTVRAGSYLPIIASANHQFAHVTRSGHVVAWDDIKDIGSSRSLLQYAGITSSDSSIHNPLLASFLGFMLSDGSVHGYQQPKFTNNNKEILERFAYVVQQLFDIDVIWREKGNGFDLGLSNKTKGGGPFPNPIKELFKSSGIAHLKKDRRLPKSIWSFDEESILHFFSAVISGDGNIYTHAQGFTAQDSLRKVPPSVEITISAGSNYYYAWDLYWLLRKIGIVPHVPYKEKNSNWKIKIGKSAAIKKLLSIRVYGKEEAQAQALQCINMYTKQTKIIKGCYRSRFTKTEGPVQELYDIETEVHHNFVAHGYVVHNSGKDVTAFNLCIRACLRKPCVIYYIFPTYAQGKKVLWDSITNDGFRILDYIPPQVIEQKNSQEMKIRFTNGSLFQIVGSDNYNLLMGTNPQGVVFSEYALQDPRAYQYIRPILTANDGWALFISTPRGKNSLYTLYELAKNLPDWFVYKLTVNDTQHISLHEIEKERAEGIMSEDLIQQEYYTSFEMGVEGSYYAKYLDKMRLDQRIGHVPWENGFKVHTAWDLGMRDNTTIIFFQVIGATVRIIDCYENSKEGLEHYINIIQSKPYTYGKHIAPHDIKVRELGTGFTRYEKARQLGITFTVAPNISVYDGIEAVRTTLGKVWIDEVQCVPLIKALENYRQEYDAKKKVYKQMPLHNWASHFADSMRYLCLSLPKTRDSLTPEELDRRYNEAMLGDNAYLPPVYRDDLPPY